MMGRRYWEGSASRKAAFSTGPRFPDPSLSPSSASSHDSLIAQTTAHDRSSSSVGARDRRDAPSLGDPSTPIHKSGRNGEEMTGSVIMRTRLRNRDSGTPGSNSGNNGSPAAAAAAAAPASGAGAARTSKSRLGTARRSTSTEAGVKTSKSDQEDENEDDSIVVDDSENDSDGSEDSEPVVSVNASRRPAAGRTEAPGATAGDKVETRRGAAAGQSTPPPQQQPQQQQEQQQQDKRSDQPDSQNASPPVTTKMETTPTRPKQTARRASARRAGNMSAVLGRQEVGAAAAEADNVLSPRRSRPSGPLLSSPRSRRRTRGSRHQPATRQDEPFEVQQNIGSRATLNGSHLPFTPPLIHTHFPNFKGCARYDGFWKQQEPQQFFDCKFYPYTEPGVDPVFAVVGGSQIIVARPAEQQKELFDILLWMDEDSSPSNHSEAPRSKRGGKGFTPSTTTGIRSSDKVELNSCAWLRHPRTQAPLLAVSGKPSAVKIINVTNKKLDRILIGHGKEVNDLAASPINPSILASASGDHTVRIWSIDPKYEKQPCLAMCAGEGHRQGLLTVAFHNKGNYLLTGGVDCAVCLWALPSLPDERSGSDKPTMIHYPHFKSTAIHMSFVDCVAFHHDLILSKSAMENKIVLWRIEGFDSRESAPFRPPTGSDGATRSSFGGKYQRLIQFSVADTSAFYLRFSVFNFPDQRPILAIGNEKSKVLFWDLEALTEYAQTQSAADPQAATTSAVHQASLSAAAGTFIPPTKTGGRWRKRGSGRGSRRGGITGGTTWAGSYITVGGGTGHHQQGEHHSRQQSVMSEASSSNVTRSETGGGGGGGGMYSTQATAADALGLSGSSRQKLADKYGMNDPFVTLDPHKLATVQKVLFACRQVAWSVGGEYLVVAGDQGMLALFGREMGWADEMEV